MLAKVVEVAATPDVEGASKATGSIRSWPRSPAVLGRPGRQALAMGGRPSLTRRQGTRPGDRPRSAEVIAGVVKCMGGSSAWAALLLSWPAGMVVGLLLGDLCWDRHSEPRSVLYRTE